MNYDLIYLAIAILITLCGVWMHWHMHSYRMHAEESMKDGKLNYRQVKLRLLLIEMASRGLTISGMALMAVRLVAPTFGRFW